MIDTSYRNDVRGWNRRYWLEHGYSREQIRAMDPAEAAYEIAFQMRDWDSVREMQDAGQHDLCAEPETAAWIRRVRRIRGRS